MNYLIISKHTIQSLQIRKPNKNKYDCCCRGLVVQYIRGIYRGCFLLLKVFLNFRLLLSHIYSIYVMRTPRTSTNVRVLTVVLPALLAGVVEFCLLWFVCGPCCCTSFWSVCFLSRSSLSTSVLPLPVISYLPNFVLLLMISYLYLQ